MENELIQLVLNYLVEGRLILVPFLMTIGYVIKNTNIIRDELIPVILIVLGVVSSVSMGGFNIDEIIQGVLSAGASSIIYEANKQRLKLKNKH